jgi:hypothetical protein
LVSIVDPGVSARLDKAISTIPVGPLGSDRRGLGIGGTVTSSGKLRWVRIDVDATSSEHLVHPEDRSRVIMVRR